MLHRKFLILMTAAAAIAAQSYGQDNIAAIPDAVSSGYRLDHRSNIIPYNTREAAIAGIPEESPYVIPLAEWKAEEVAGGTKFSTRFKILNNWDNRAVIFRIEGVTSSFSVTCNGEDAGYSQAGMGRTDFNLTKLSQLYYNDIEVTVYADAAARHITNHRPDARPAFRKAYVISQPTVMIRDITADTQYDEGRGYLDLGVIVNSQLMNPKTYTVYWELIAPDGTRAGNGERDITTTWYGEDTLRFTAMVPDVKRWNHETPYLYTLVLSSKYDYRYREFIPMKVGFREAGHPDGYLTIDGAPVALVTNEAQYGRNDAETLAELQFLKDRGVNCVLVKGNPQPDAFYRFCDELGLYVCDMADVNTSREPQATTKGGNPSNDPAWAGAYVDRAMEMYKGSRNHPSVIMFSPAEKSVNGYCLYESYLALKDAEKQRPVVYKQAGGEWNSDDISLTPPAGAKSDKPFITFAKGDSGAPVVIFNNSMFAQAAGMVNYKVMKGKSVKAKGTVEATITPGGRFEVDIPGDQLAKAKKKRGIQVEFVIPAERFNDGANGGVTASEATVNDSALPKVYTSEVISY